MKMCHLSRCTFATMISPIAIMAWLSLSSASVTCADWPQASGPNHDYQTQGHASTEFSVAQGQHVLWTTSLPNTGESTPIVSGGRVFLTCHTPMTADAESGRDILAMCFDAGTGQELWRRTLPATRVTDMASGFSDNTAASPVSDGDHVCFVNVGGSIHTYDFDGTLIWKHEWVPFGRHHARQQEPILHDGQVIVLKTVAEDLPVSATTKTGAKPLGRDPKYWTRLHAFDLATGKLHWVAEPGTSVHSASLLNATLDGKQAILTGRGGGHQPPEEPYGISLLDAMTGKTIWNTSIKGYAAHQNAVWKGERGALFVGLNHHRIDMKRGSVGPPVSLTQGVRQTRFESGAYLTSDQVDLETTKKKALTYHTNILVGDFHYFRTHVGHQIGRVDLQSGHVEYLQMPVQVVTDASSDRTLLWDDAPANQVRNNDGFVVYQDARATRDGWGHVSAASPIIVGPHLYMPTMLGTVYVLRWDAKRLDSSALISVSDLGPAGKTWSLSSMAHSDGRLYARTLKQLICIGQPDGSTNDRH